MSRIFGVDVSHFQSVVAPAGVPWADIAEKCKFAIVRATYGNAPDPSAVEHIKRARGTGLQVGLYGFFRSTLGASEQIDAFCAQALRCKVGEGDIAPALDIEDDLTAKLDPSWAELASRVVDGYQSEFGEAMVYITQRDFGRLGKPSWVLDRPLWVAHYTNAPAPATPGNKPWAIWQRRVGPFAPDGPGGAIKPMLLDQNVCDVPLPLASFNPSLVDPAPTPPADDSHADYLAMRLANGLMDGLDLSHGAEDV